MSIEVIMNESVMNATKEVVYKVIDNLSIKYNFDKEEALCNIGFHMLSSSSSSSKSKSSKSSKSSSVSLSREVKPKARFALPYSGELDSSCCQGLRQNQGLYTQCGSIRMDSSVFCKSCQTSADKNNGVPEYGTIGERLKAYTEGIEYRDPSGKSPVPYAKIMKKLKLSREEVEEEAGKLNMVINPIHFETEGVKKSGRPAKLEKKPEGEVKPKGRPKKAKKVLELAGEEEDLFASLVMSANKNDSDSEDEVDEKADTVIMTESEDDFDAEEEAKLSAKLAAKEEANLVAKLAAEEEANLAAEEEANLAVKLAAEEEANLAAEAKKLAVKLAAEEKASKKKVDDESKLAAKKAAEEKKESERLEKEAKKKAAEEEKEAKKKVAEAEKEAKKKAEKEAKKKAAEMEKPKKAKKDEKNPSTVEVSNKEMSSSTVEDEEEQDVVRRFEFEGKKYLKSKKSGIIYNMEQDVIGKWNEAKQRIEFDAIEEESCDEYEE